MNGCREHRIPSPPVGNRRTELRALMRKARKSAVTVFLNPEIEQLPDLRCVVIQSETDDYIRGVHKNRNTYITRRPAVATA